MNLTSGKKISPTGSVSRADFTVTADAITSYISTNGDLIATIDTGATSGTSVSTDTDVSTVLKAGDTVYFHGAVTGRVFKRTVATVTGSDFTITSAFSGDDTVAVGDYVFGGTIVGMRIDADGVDFVNTHIKSDNYNGTIDSGGVITANGNTGWAITKSGEAEFANLTVRGTLSSIEGDINLQSTGSIVFAGGGSLNPRSLQAGTGTLSLGGQSIDIGSGLIIASEDAGSITIAGTSTGAVSIGSTSADLSLTTTTSGDININAATALNIQGKEFPSYATGYLYYNGTSLSWSSAGGGGATSLGSLSDVSITSAATGDLLRYNGSSWVDYPDSNYAAASHTHAATDITSGTLASARLSGSYTGITGVGALSAGSITSGFGSIATANTISTTSKIYVGGSTYASDGIQLDYNAGNPRFYVGDGADSYFQFDGTTAKLNGGLVTNLASGSDIGIQGWSSDIIFSATDVDTVSWTTGTIKLADGTTYSSIGSGNTGNMTALTYIYFDSASPTALATTTTAANAIGTGKILIAVAQKNTDTGATEAVFQAFGGRGGQLLNAASIAANSITANEIAANTITAAQIVAGTITATELASNSVTAAKINVTDLSAVNTSTGSLTVSGTLTMGASGSIIAGDVADGSIFSSNGIKFVYDRAGVVGAVHKITWTNENSSESVSLGYTSTYNAPANLYLLDDWRITSAVDVLISAPNINLSGVGKVSDNIIWHAGNIPFSLSSVASGDIIYNNGSNWVNLAKGSDGQTLTLSSGVPTWATPASGVTTFIGLSDTPANYTGDASKLLRVNSSANAVEFVDGSTLYQAADAHLDDLAALATVSGAEDIMVSSGAGAWEYKDAVYMEANLNGTNNGPKFVGSNIYGSGGTPANQTFSGWLYVRVSGNVYRVPLYADGS